MPRMPLILALVISTLSLVLGTTGTVCFASCTGALGSADGELRELERRAHTGGYEELFRYWAALRRVERVPEMFTALAGTAQGRPTSDAAKQALEVYKASIITGDRRFLPDELPHRLRDLALKNGFTLEQFLEQTPRFTQMIPLIRPGEEIEFLMGAGERERESFYSPHIQIQHRVKLNKPVLIGANLVTVGFWRAVLGSLPPGYAREGIFTPHDNEPIRFVSYNMITREFFPELNQIMKGSGVQFRLPTEAELELTMRMDESGKPTTRIFPWGDQWSRNHSHTNVLNNWRQAPLVDTKTPTGLLFADTVGMLWQWTRDVYPQNEGRTPSISLNPKGPKGNAGSLRVLRGGIFWDHPVYNRSTSRYWGPPDDDWYHVGFRLAGTPEKQRLRLN